jgi:hypothetical protein
MKLFGVVETDNYGGDYPDEKFIVGYWLTEKTAEQIAKLLNDEIGEADRCHKVVKRGYKLQPGFEP